ncbi:MAG TPA: HNH endonuclease, partial [Micromonosporaceae bacterium]|nr:HNH endonuclease [Micromonosporaceae bacterium]
MTDVLTARARAAAIGDAALLDAVVAVADRDPLGFDADQVAFTLVWTQAAARQQVEFGRYLQRVVKPLWAAMCAGDIDVARARVFYDVLCAVDDGVAFGIALEHVDLAPGWTTGQLRDRLRRAVLRADPHGAAERTARTVAQRRVELVGDRESTAGLYALCLPAARAVAAFERVDAIARARHSAADGRTLDQLRADTLLDLLEGVGVGVSAVHRRGVVELTIPWSTLAGGRAS